jgi:ferredoxin
LTRTVKMAGNPLIEADLFTKIIGVALRRLYGKDEKLPRVWRRMILFLPERFGYLGRIRFLRNILPVFDPAKTNFSVIPVNTNIEGAENTVLPLEIIDELIDRSGVQVVMKKCLCRHNYDCTHYPPDVGCLFLGESALETPRNWQKRVDREGAKAHARKAVSLGLVPMVGKIRFDSDTLGIVDRGKLLTVCFCCECCCLGRFLAPIPADLLDTLQHPVEGISLEFTDACTGCGECAETCYLNAIEIIDGRAVRNDTCRLCGRCAARCPNRAIRIRLDNPNAARDVVERILSIVEI